MTRLRAILVAAIVGSIAAASFASTAQAENRKGPPPSRMMIKKHAMKHHMMKHKKTM